MRLLAQHVRQLADETAELQQRITTTLRQHTPELLNTYGAGSDTAAALLIAMGDNPERLRHEAAFAALCGVSPVEAEQCSRSVDQPWEGREGRTFPNDPVTVTE